ncbi:MAG TPA: hypothetical protein PK098_08995 [Phycisphaerales bacterium]|nr:hypothetical protein [Phycisphaerales bacterium]
MKGIVVISIPKSGTNFLSRSLAELTGWRPRWGRPSRDLRLMQSEIPHEPDPYVAERAIHLVQTEKDLLNIPEHERPTVFGGRKLVAVKQPPGAEEMYIAAMRHLKEHVIIAEHPVRSIPYLIRNPKQVPITMPEEVEREAAELDYGVVFLRRELKDTANSFAHFLHAGTRYVQFRTLDDAFDVVINEYIPVLAKAIRIWRDGFSGMKIAYEDLVADPQRTLDAIRERFNLTPVSGTPRRPPDQVKAFTFRKGGSGDWRNHLPAAHCKLLDEQYPDLVEPGQ